mgnify:CR=1 FL=1
MRDPYGEELATYTGPESCVDSRKAIGEALTGGVRAGLLSRERCNNFRVPTLSTRWKATPTVSILRDAFGPCVVGDLGHVHKLFAREPGGPTFGLIARSAL